MVDRNQNRSLIFGGCGDHLSASAWEAGGSRVEFTSGEVGMKSIFFSLNHGVSAGRLRGCLVRTANGLQWAVARNQ